MVTIKTEFESLPKINTFDLKDGDFIYGTLKEDDYYGCADEITGLFQVTENGYVDVATGQVFHSIETDDNDRIFAKVVDVDIVVKDVVKKPATKKSTKK
jgi:hypothetical protein